MTRVVDASVALRWYVESPASAAAQALLAGDEPLVAPDLVVAEVTNAAWKLVRAGEIDEDHGAAIAGAVGSAFSLLVPATELAGRAFRLAHRLDHPVYDCLYLALAERDGAAVVTADRRLSDRASRGGWRGRIELVGG